MILSFNILHLLKDVAGVIQRINQLLKSGGFFVTLTPCIAQIKLLNFLLFIISKTGLLPHINTFKINELKSLIENNNFQILENITLDNNPLEHFIIAKKQ